MTNETILKQAIEKAVKNGYGGWFISEHFEERIKEEFEYDKYFSTIFSHDFAEHFWGEKAVCDMCGARNGKSCACDGWLGGGLCEKWIYHLQEMVKEKEPLQYLKKFL